MSGGESLSRPPKAETFSVSELVLDARRGRIRVPRFQRDLKWEAEDVRKLFDSILRGYPIGSLLLWRRPETPSGSVRIGPIHVQNADTTDVRWLVDGQQRVTALTAALTAERDSDPRYDIYFDPASSMFELSGPRGPEEHWVAVHRLFDAADLGEFLFDWPPGLEDKGWRRRLLEAGKRIREYQLPAYLIESDDDSILREIFRRTNRQGKQLTEAEVFNALDEPARSNLQPLKLASAEVESLSWGRLKDSTLLAAVLANENLDPTRRIDQQSPRDAEDRLRGAVERLIPGLQATVAFLRSEARIPHRRLLPYRTPLIVLPPIFVRHRFLTPRQRRLLVRWVWRGFLTGAHQDDRKVELRRAAKLAASGRDVDLVVHELLTMVPHEEHPWRIGPEDRYDARAARQRIGLLGLALLKPRAVDTGSPVNIATLLNAQGHEGFRALISKPGPYKTTLANRVLHPKRSSLRKALRERTRQGLHDPILFSHAITANAARALLAGDLSEFLKLRADTIEKVVADRASAFAEWSADDTSSLRSLLERAS